MLPRETAGLPGGPHAHLAPTHLRPQTYDCKALRRNPVPHRGFTSEPDATAAVSSMTAPICGHTAIQPRRANILLRPVRIAWQFARMPRIQMRETAGLHALKPFGTSLMGITRSPYHSRINT